MNIEKRGKKYRIREMVGGKTYSVMTTYKPTNKEARQLLDEEEEKSFSIKTSVVNSIREYIEVKKNILSPSTIFGYQKIINQLEKKYREFAITDIRDIKKIDLQNFVNQVAKNHSPKTTRNIFGLVKVSLEMFTDINYKITLPQRIKKEPYIPSQKEVAMLWEYSKNTKYYIPIKLASYGLRFSEIIGLDVSDVYEDKIYVHQARVQVDGQLITKTTKTYSSTRYVAVEKEICDLIKSQGIVYNGSRSSVNRFIYNFCVSHQINYFSIHKLRHFFASVFSHIPNQYLGWTSRVMQDTYVHRLQDVSYADEIRSKMAQIKTMV